jgi:acetyl-CoA carboxylase biotin carboxylase subunit
MITGVDIVKQQIRIAANEPLSIRQDQVAWNGHAVEFRINAEDPDQGFRPDPGQVSRFEVPKGDGIRLETHVEAGYQIPPFYDSMIAKLIVSGDDRDAALEAGRQALAAFNIEGVATTIPLHRRVLEEPAFRAGRYDTRWLEALLNEREE